MLAIHFINAIFDELQWLPSGEIADYWPRLGMQESWADVARGDRRLFISIQDKWLVLVQAVNWVVVQWERLDAQQKHFKEVERSGGNAPLLFIGCISPQLSQ